MNCLEAEDLGDMVEAGLLVISSPLVRKRGFSKVAVALVVNEQKASLA